MTVRRSLLPLAVLALASPALTSCQLLTGGSSLDDAFEVVPAGATGVVFTDRAAVADRLDVDDVGTGDEEERLDEYVAALEDEPVAGTTLLAHLRTMQDAAFSELDVAWSVLGFLEEGAFVIYKVDDVDLDDLVDDLEEAGLDATDEPGGRTSFAPDVGASDDDGLLGGAYPTEFATGVLVDPDEGLVVTGSATQDVLAVLEDDEDSLTDADAYADLLNGIDDDVLYASLSTEPPCSRIGETEEGVAASEEVGDLGTPVAHALVVRGEDAEPTARLQFDDEDAAEADAEARATYLDDGVSLRTAQPLADLGSFEVTQDGDLVTVEIDLAEPRILQQLAGSGDAFFACAPAPS